MNLVAVTTKLPAEEVEALRARAASQDRTMSAEIRRAVRTSLAGGPVDGRSDARDAVQLEVASG